MGKSAKLHKRVPKKTKTGSSSGNNPTGTSSAAQVQAAKKRANLKAKSSSSKGENGELLGGADYVTLMMGGRRKAREEAKKLPKSDS
ncbi:hypothetical protein BJ165DRAFT_1527637 [Panaeolus papilionaceus]|nr:hypothetical protein BJ165DRAFT_1527637 [Panaeolus papilionaceus]